MAINEFWISVRTAASMMVPKAAVDSPRLEPDRIERILRGATFWLTPGAIKGYEAQDFDFLSKAERDLLDEGVKEFASVAKFLPTKAPATDEQIDEGVTGFRKILEVMRPDKYPDFDAFVIGKKIEGQVRGKLPDWVKEMVFETGYDSSGGQALWVWVEVEDSATKDKLFYDNFSLVSQTLREAAAQISPERWPYIRLRTVSEQRPKEVVRRPRARSKKK